MFKKNVLLSKFSHYKIGGPATFFFAAKNDREVRWAVAEAKKEKLPIFILGGGTNLLIDDLGFKGLVLKSDIKFNKKKAGTRIEAGAGALMADVLKNAERESFAGLEWAAGLPGTVGGAVRGNAGCFGGEIKDSALSVRSYDMKTGKTIVRSAEECDFGYRSSIFKKKAANEIILSVTFQLWRGDRKAIAKASREKIAYRKERQPGEYPSIGSMFKNIPLARLYKKGSKEYKDAVAARTIQYCGSEFSIKTDPFPVLSAAKMISESGLRGVSFGGAMISPKHPNFFVNVLAAGSGDVKNLITLTKAEVKQRFNVDLEEEIQIV
jgi:UDP-N-acetylmuramate dehydrogenase